MKPAPAPSDTQARSARISTDTETRSRRKTGEITAVTIKKARVRPVMITNDDTATFSLPHDGMEEVPAETIVLREAPKEAPVEMPAEAPVETTAEAPDVAPAETVSVPEPEEIMDRPVQPRVIEVKPLPRVIPLRRREIVRVSSL